MRFYIYSPPYNSLSGGIMCLHRLAYEMTILGEDVIMVSDTKNPDWTYNQITHECYHQNSCDYAEPRVAIYPEIVIDNPFNCPIVVRWLLNTPGVMGGNGIFAPGDLVYKYGDCYKAPDESKVKGLLTTFNMDSTRRFKDLKLPRKGVCYLRRKGAYKPPINHPNDALCIDDYGSKGGDDYLIEIFNTYETFISYDHATFLSIQAALCGCISIVVPNELNREDYNQRDLFKGYGRSYGPEHIDWAISTQPDLRIAVEDIFKQSTEQIKKLIEDCKQAEHEYKENRVSKHIEG